jgi:undecaprenyl diphosphate synthase
MDGNGRWAKRRGLPRTEGHRQGVKVVRNITKSAAEHGIKHLTLFAFSTENWKRSEYEVNFLFNLFVEAIQAYIPELKGQSIRLNFIGDIIGLPSFLRSSLKIAKDQTRLGNKMQLNIAINYGGRHEIIDAVKNACKSQVEINEDNFPSFLYTAGIPDPDIIIRTSGEMRLSNFLLFQSAYSEFFFTKTLWPDFSEQEFLDILDQYNKRDRKFGEV